MEAGDGAAVGGSAAGASGLAVFGAGTVNVGRTDRSGLMIRLAGVGSTTGAAAGGAATTFSTGGAGGCGAGGFAATGGTTTGGFGAGGGVGASALRRSKLATSPGLEICERSILVLISDSPERDPPSRPEAEAPPCPAKCLRTRSASSASIELECVFFSVTPTKVRTSRMALLLTSNSLARSLIRTLLIRPVFSPKSG